jgi:hypothetical protein
MFTIVMKKVRLVMFDDLDFGIKDVAFETKVFKRIWHL